MGSCPYLICKIYNDLILWVEKLSSLPSTCQFSSHCSPVCAWYWSWSLGCTDIYMTSVLLAFFDECWVVDNAASHIKQENHFLNIIFNTNIYATFLYKSSIFSCYTHTVCSIKSFILMIYLESGMDTWSMDLFDSYIIVLQKYDCVFLHENMTVFDSYI
jgi:hypothetical protein